MKAYLDLAEIALGMRVVLERRKEKMRYIHSGVLYME